MTDPILSARIAASTIDFERAAKRVNALSEKMARQVANDNKRAASESRNAWQKADLGGTISRSFGGGLAGIKGDLAALSGTIAVSLGARAAISAADTWVRYSNSLKVAGLEGENLVAVQEKLSVIARDNATDLETLGSLFGTLTQRSKDLGATQADVMQSVESVAMALRISGQSAESASGALLQLGQAFAGDKVQAQEWNSILEGMPALANAMAHSTDKYGGSVGKLTAAVKAGKLAPIELLAMLKESEAFLREQAASSNLSFAQSMVVMKNALIEYIGKADQGMGATATLGQAIRLLAGNLDLIANAVLIVGAAFATKYTAGMIAAGISTVRTSAFMTGWAASAGMMTRATLVTTTAINGLKAGMAFLGGPIGIAIMAVVAGISMMSARTAELKRRTMELPQSFMTTSDKIDEYKDAQLQAATATGHAAAKSRERAAALREEITELIRLRSIETQSAIDKATRAQRQAREARQRQIDHQRPNGAGEGYWSQQAGLNAQAEGNQRRADQLTAEANLQITGLGAQRDRINAPPVRPTGGAGAGAGSGTGRGSGSSAPTAAEYAANDAAALREAQMVELAARIAIAETIQHRQELENEQAELTQKAAREAITNNKDLTDTGRAAALSSLEAAQANEDIARTKAQQKEIAERAVAVAEDDLAHTRAISEMEASRYDTLASMADTEEERARFEALAFVERQNSAKLQFEADQDRLAAARVLLGMDQAEIERRRNAATASFNSGQQTESDDFTKGQKDRASEGSWGNWFKDNLKDARDFNGQLQDMASQGIAQIGDAFANAATGAASFKEAMGDMVKGVISSLMKLFVQWAIWEGIGLATGNGSGWGLKMLGMSGGGSGKGTKATGAKVGKNRDGTGYWPGGMTMVGESGPELLNLPRGSGVLSNNSMKAALSAGQRSRDASPSTTVVNVNLDAKDAVLSSTVQAWITTGISQGLQVGRQLSAKDQARAQGQSLIRPR